MKVGLVLCGILLAGCAAPAPQPVQDEPVLEAIVPTTIAAPPPEPKRPRRLTMEGGIKAPIVPAVLDGGALLPPGDPAVVGWWGQKVGAPEGATLLVGHTVSARSRATYGRGTLDNLEDTEIGSTIKVSGIRYTVTDVTVMSKPALAERAPDLFSQTGPHRLVLVTCEGYVPATRVYEDNVVVTAVVQ